MPPLAGLRILVVDDDAMVRFILTTELEDAGGVVTEAPDARAAITHLDDGQAFDLLVTDIRMPGMDGWALAERARASRPALPVLYVTGWSEESPRPVAGSEILAKPFRPAQLVDTAARLIGRP